MSLITVNFQTNYEDSNKFQFERETTIEEMLLTFLKNSNSKVTLDPSEISFIYNAIILNTNNNLKKKIKDVFKSPYACQIRVIDTSNILMAGIPIAECFIKFEDYKSYFINLHKKISEFFDENYSNLNYDETYKQNFVDFINSMDIEEKYTIIQLVNKINSGAVHEFIQAYTGETPLCYLLNKCLRKCDMNEFDKIKYFVGPFSYSLYKNAYNDSKMRVNYSKKFYRKMVLKSKDYEKYKNNIGELICYPAFTSTIEKDIIPTPTAIEINNIKSDDIYVVLLIDYKCNNPCYPTPCVNVSYDSVYSGEKEYIFPPFSFFKIEKLENRSGTSKNPHIIYMSVPNKRILIEFAIKNNKNIIYDKNLNELYSS